MIGAIAGARKSIFIEMYILWTIPKRINSLKILSEKAEEGVKVKVIIDSFGSQELSQKPLSNLKAPALNFYFSVIG